MSWSRQFDDPVPGCETLRDAASYILKLPKAEQELPHWQDAAEALTLVAELGGDIMLARIGMLRALNRGKTEPERRKKARQYRVVG